MTEVDCAALARRALDTLADVSAESGAQVEVGELPVVVGVGSLLTQLFQNLLGNAMKFRAPARACRIRLDAGLDGQHWHFRCQDNGIGVEPQYTERIFVIFQRLHSKDLYDGTGIGLSLCKKIVEYTAGRSGSTPTARTALPCTGPCRCPPDPPPTPAPYRPLPHRPPPPTGGSHRDDREPDRGSARPRGASDGRTCGARRDQGRRRPAPANLKPSTEAVLETASGPVWTGVRDNLPTCLRAHPSPRVRPPPSTDPPGSTN